MTTETKFVPTEIWTPESDELEESIERAIHELNQKKPEQLIDELKQKVQKSPEGIQYAVLDGDRPTEYSDTDALVLFTTHANTITSNNLVRAEFIREAARFAGVRDDKGRLKPVIMLGSPGVKGSKPRLEQGDKELIRSGYFGPLAKEMLKAVSTKGIGRVSLLGFSEGADMATAGARYGYSANLDVGSLAVGDPAVVEERSQLALAKDFLKSGSSFQKAIEDSGIDAQKVALGAKPWSWNRNKDFTRFGVTALLDPVNRDLWKGLTHNSFEYALKEVLDGGGLDKIIVAYGERSSITKPEVIEPILERVNHKYEPEVLSTIKVQEATHAWGDNLSLLAKLYMRALT